MNTRLASILVIVNLFLVFTVVNGTILKKRKILDEGRLVLMELAPRDPRSLMQGDYMVLRQALLNDQASKTKMEKEPTRGKLVMKMDDKNIATFARPDDGTALSENEVFLKYRRSKRRYHFGLESFFFQEGDGKEYATAKHCEVKIDEGGNAVLVDLVKENSTQN